MSKILKASFIQVDSDNKINIEVPAFKAKNNNEAENIHTVNHEISFENFDEISLTDDLNNDFKKDSSLTYEETIENANIKADEIIDNAKTEAENIINDALSEAEFQKNEIFENARAEGYDEGVRSAEDLKVQANQVLEDALREKQEMLESIEEEVVEVVINTVSKLISKTLDLDKSVILNIVRQGLSQTTISGDVFIRVAESDYDIVTQNKEDFLNLVDSNTNIEIVKDFSFDKGDCVIETPFGNIDCSLSQQFDGLKKNLYYILENR